MEKATALCRPICAKTPEVNAHDGRHVFCVSLSTPIFMIPIQMHRVSENSFFQGLWLYILRLLTGGQADFQPDLTGQPQEKHNFFKNEQRNLSLQLCSPTGKKKIFSVAAKIFHEVNYLNMKHGYNNS